MIPATTRCPRCGPDSAAATPAVTAGLSGLPDGLPYTVYRCPCGFEFHDRAAASAALKVRVHHERMAKAKGA